MEGISNSEQKENSQQFHTVVLQALIVHQRIRLEYGPTTTTNFDSRLSHAYKSHKK